MTNIENITPDLNKKDGDIDHEAMVYLFGDEWIKDIKSIHVPETTSGGFWKTFFVFIAVIIIFSGVLDSLFKYIPVNPIITKTVLSGLVFGALWLFM